MAKKAYLKGEEFVFTRVKGSSETDYRDGDVNINPTNLGLGNVNNTSDSDKPVSTAQRKAIDDAYANSNKYTDQKIADLIGGASETMDTLKEVEQAIVSSKSTEEALNKAIGTKANQTELDTHTGNDTIHITASERAKWNKNGGVTGVRGSAEADYKTGQVTISKENIGLGNVENTKDIDKNVNSAEYLKMYDNNTQSSALVRFEHAPLSMATDGVEVVDPSYVPIGYDATNHLLTYGEKIDTADEVVNFTSGDSTTGDSTAPAVITSGETHKSLFNKISTAVKNVRWLLSKMGTTDISAIGNGTVTGALSTLNSNIVGVKKHYFTSVFGSVANVAKNVWVKSNKDITVSESGIYIVNFPFLRDQGGVDTAYLTQIKIDTSDSLSSNQEPDIGCVATNWGITSMTYLCELQAGKTYHIWLRHTASQTHTIDYHCYYAKM